MSRTLILKISVNYIYNQIVLKYNKSIRLHFFSFLVLSHFLIFIQTYFLFLSVSLFFLIFSFSFLFFFLEHVALEKWKNTHKSKNHGRIRIISTSVTWNDDDLFIFSCFFLFFIVFYTWNSLVTERDWNVFTIDDMLHISRRIFSFALSFFSVLYYFILLFF